VKAHIMPNSMNRVLRKVLDDDPNSPMLTIDKNTGKTKPLPMGVYDKTILCGSCDGSFSPWEKHTTEILFTHHQWADLKYDRRGRPVCYTLLNADYANLKLFVLSMLWKTAVSSLAFCAKVNVPRDSLQKLEQMLSTSNPGSATDFTIRIAHFYNDDAPMTFEPHTEVIDGITYAIMHVPGYKILVQLDKKLLPNDHSFILAPGVPVRIGLLNFQSSPERRAVVKMAAKL
jgi:hypothetical protein